MKRLILTVLAVMQLFVPAMGQLWQSLDGGVDQMTMDLTSDSARGVIYVAGKFSRAGDSAIAQVATWDGQRWGKLGNYPTPPPCMGPCGTIYSAVGYGNDVFVGGSFTVQNTVFLGEKNAYRFDGASWDSCGNPSPAPLFDILNDDLFAFGYFGQISGLPATGVARWNGASWVPFGDSIPDFGGGTYLGCGEYYQGNHYFGGNFELDNQFRDILYWNGNQWLSPGLGILGLSSVVDKVKAYKGLLYVGGYFHAAAGNADDMLMTWNGNDWQPTFPNVQFTSQVYDLEVIGGKLYIVARHHVWDGSAWQGPFSIGRFDGQEFCSFGGTIDVPVADIAGLNGELYITCSNAILQGDTVNFIAQWMGGNTMDICVSNITAVAPPFVQSIKLFPNPSQGSFELELPAGVADCSVRILDVAGREVMGAFSYTGSAVNIGQLPKGLYFVDLIANGQRQVIKLVQE